LNQELRINFPKPGDKKAWKSINDHLTVILPQRFSARKIASTPSSDLAKEFDDFLHSRFQETFGIKPVALPKPAFPQKPHRGLERLRQRKKEMVRARKALHTAGLKGSEADNILHQKWLALVRAHSRLSAAVRKKAAAKNGVAQQKMFKKNPFAFGTNLFKNTKKGVEIRFPSKKPLRIFQHIS